jgi:hypothetical protein
LLGSRSDAQRLALAPAAVPTLRACDNPGQAASGAIVRAGLGFLVWGWAFLGKPDEADPAPAAHDPLTRLALTLPQRALGRTCSWGSRGSCFRCSSAA